MTFVFRVHSFCFYYCFFHFIFTVLVFEILIFTCFLEKILIFQNLNIRI